MKPTYQYNLPQIRKLLNAVFNDPGLDALCLDYFTVVYDQFGRGQGKQEKITQLLVYCRKDDIHRFESLFSIIRDKDEKNFQRFEPLLREQNNTFSPPSEAENQTEIKSLLVALREWKLIHNDLQEALNMFRDILDHLTSYRFKSDPYFLDQSYLAWKGLYTAKLKQIPSKWNLQYVKISIFSEVQATSLEIDKISEEIIDESREINFKYLLGKFIGLRELLWSILDMADSEIVKLVDNIYSQMGG